MPRISNDFDPDGTSAFLRDSGKKEEFLRRLAAYTAVYGLDGWNMDFECMNPKDAPLYTELVAGAAERMHAMNKELSVDIMPIGAADSYWTGCYDRKGLAEHADYEILMGYDQTGGSSPHAGPNAACDWLERILPPLLKEVPAEKLVLGMPLYTRVWTGDDGAVRSDILTVRRKRSGSFMRTGGKAASAGEPGWRNRVLSARSSACSMSTDCGARLFGGTDSRRPLCTGSWKSLRKNEKGEAEASLFPMLPRGERQGFPFDALRTAYYNDN